MHKKKAGAIALFLTLLSASQLYAGFTETVPQGMFIIDESIILSEVSGAWDNEGNLGPIIKGDQRYEPTTGELLGTLTPNVEAKFNILVNMLQFGILDSLTAVMAIPVVLSSEVQPNFTWEPGDVIAQYGRRFETIDDFWAYASGYGQPEITDWSGNEGVLADIVLGMRHRFTDWFPWFRNHGLAGALTIYGALPTGTVPDPEEIVAAGTATWNLHFQGELGFHGSVDYLLPYLDDRVTLGVDVFYEMFFKKEYTTPTGTIHKILLIDQHLEAGDTYTVNPGNFVGVSAQVDIVPYKGPALATWLSGGSKEKAEKLPPLFTFTFRYTYTHIGQSDWQSNSALWDWEDKEEIWQPGYKNILTFLGTVSLFRLGVPLQIYGGYRNQNWIPGKNFRAASVATAGFRVPLKFW